MNYKQKQALDAFNRLLSRRRKACRDLAPPDDPIIPDDEEDYASDYYAAGTGFAPDDLEDEITEEMKQVAEENEGDIKLLFDDNSKGNDLKQKIMDAIAVRLSRRKQAFKNFTGDTQIHAPKGGVTLKGKKFTGGEFIPAEGVREKTSDSFTYKSVNRPLWMGFGNTIKQPYERIDDRTFKVEKEIPKDLCEQLELEKVQTTDAQVHAPKGGVTVKGKKFIGGQFIPSEGGYQEAYEKMKKEKPEPEEKTAKTEPAPEEKKKSKSEKEEPIVKEAVRPYEAPQEEYTDPEDEPKPKKGKKKEKVRTPEQQAKYDAMVKKKKEWRAKAVKITVGVEGKELQNDLSTCQRRRQDAIKFWKDNLDVDIENGATGDDGYSPNDLVKLVMGNDKFKNLPIMDKISLVSEMQRKQLIFAYSQTNPVKQNRKQEAALVFGADTVRGCLNNCISCYACMLAGGMSTTKFDTPVASKLTKKLILGKDDIQKDLKTWSAKMEQYKNDPKAFREVKISPEHPEGKVMLYDEAEKNVKHYQKQLKEMEIRGIDHTILRIGVVGDPATNWKHTCDEISKGLKGKPSDNILFVSKLQRIDGFDPKIIKNMHVSVDPFNSKHMDITMANVRKLKKENPDLNIVLRIRSFDSNNKELKANLKKAVDFANENDLPVLETKMRYSSTIADLLEMNKASYHQTKGSNIKANHNFLGTKGHDADTKKDFENPNNPLKANKHLECDPYLTGCQACGNCANTATKNYPWNGASYIDVQARKKELAQEKQ